MHCTCEGARSVETPSTEKENELKRIAIIGGETHIGEITGLHGSELEIVAVSVKDDQTEWAEKQFGVPIVESYRAMLKEYEPDVVAVANENDLKGKAIVDSLEAGCDVIADKPLAITMDEQRAVEKILSRHPERGLLNLLTLRGVPHWRALHDLVQDGAIGIPSFAHVRMAVRLKREQRPPWFLDIRRSGGLFLDLLIHGLDQVEWITGRRIVAMAAVTGNLSDPEDPHFRDHASVFCELDNGASAVVEGQRMLPDTKGSDYRVHVTGTGGFADLDHEAKSVAYTNETGGSLEPSDFPEAISVVSDWLHQGGLVSQEASLRANYLALTATDSARRGERLPVA